ncbi:MAG: DMT family transporter [Steroidobacterales bacterium]
MSAPPSAEGLLAGLLWGLLAVGIWAGSFVLLRLGVRTTLNPYDVTALRFATAGLVLAPVVWREGWALPRLGWGGLALAITGAGAPYALLVAEGLVFAPAAHAAALIPGLTAVLTAMFGTWILKESITPVGWLGTALILGGTVVIGGISASIGQGLFLLAALLWSGYVILMRRAAINSMHAVAVVAVGSALLYLPVYVAVIPKAIGAAPFADIALQALYQGLFTTIVGLFAFNRAIANLGAARGAALSALIPVSTLVLAAQFLGERPGVADTGAALLIGAGVAMVTMTRRPAPGASSGD